MIIADFPHNGSDAEKYKWVAIVATHKYLRDQTTESNYLGPRISMASHQKSTPWDTIKSIGSDVDRQALLIRQEIVDRLNRESSADRSRLFAEMVCGSRETIQYEDKFNVQFAREPASMQRYFDECWDHVSAEFVRPFP